MLARAQLVEWYRHGEEFDTCRPLVVGGGIFGVEAFVVFLDCEDVEA